jgi:DNA-binding transcriptional ArsR family regulator
MNDFTKLAEHAAEATSLLKELANDKRLMICCTLIDGEHSVTELNTKIPLSQSALSQHLARLRDAQLVCTRKEALTVYYRLSNPTVVAIISTLKSIYCPEE